MTGASIAAWAGLFSGAVALILGLIKAFQEWKTGEPGRSAEAFAKRAEGSAKSIEATAVEHRIWMEGTESLVAALERECKNCSAEVERFENSVYGLFDDLEEQIAPMLMLLPGGDAILNALRVAMRNARNRLRPPHPAPENSP